MERPGKAGRGKAMEWREYAINSKGMVWQVEATHRCCKAMSAWRSKGVEKQRDELPRHCEETHRLVQRGRCIANHCLAKKHQFIFRKDFLHYVKKNQKKYGS